MDLKLITQELGLEPFKCFKSKKRGNIWNYVWKFNRNENVMNELSEIVNFIYPYTMFFKEIVKDGGTVQLIVNLPGMVNHGLEINNTVLDKIVDMGMDLGVEVFPDWENENPPDERPDLKIVT